MMVFVFLLVVGDGGDTVVVSDSASVSIVEISIVSDVAAASNLNETKVVVAATVDRSSRAAGDASAQADDGALSHQSSSSVSVGLRTGHFDAADVKLLRTCSEPDLSCLSRPIATSTHKAVRCSVTSTSSRDSAHDDNVVADVVSTMKSLSKYRTHVGE